MSEQNGSGGRCDLIPFTISEYRRASPESKQLYWKWRAKAKKDDEKIIAKIEYMRLKPDVKARYVEYARKYRQRLDVKARIAEYRRKYFQRPYVKERMKAYYARDDIKKKRAAQKSVYYEKRRTNGSGGL